MSLAICHIVHNFEIRYSRPCIQSYRTLTGARSSVLVLSRVIIQERHKKLSYSNFGRNQLKTNSMMINVIRIRTYYVIEWEWIPNNNLSPTDMHSQKAKYFNRRRTKHSYFASNLNATRNGIQFTESIFDCHRHQLSWEAHAAPNAVKCATNYFQFC